MECDQRSSGGDLAMRAEEYCKSAQDASAVVGDQLLRWRRMALFNRTG